MNRFRKQKKAKEAPEGQVRVSTESEVPSLHSKKSRAFGRSKKQEPEPMPEPQLDVANALPSTDDFRTSLLMSGLSARFSMLREQDDPKSKIGKASDDSVLFPKSGTKFNNFDFQRPYGLSDIAEVSSINGSVRPPFADLDRKDSYSTLTGSAGDDDSIHSGSIMSRAKPGEGNNLFGGRQKIYKLAGNSSSSTKSLGDGGNMSGRAVYDHDVSQSAFQKLRDREKEQEREQVLREESEAQSQSSRPPSPPLSGYNRNRETSSTTSSAQGNVRISTAATSVTSQRTPSLKGDHTPITPNGSVNGNLERSATKTRRLYETGLDQHLHEQQHSAMNRIDTLSRQRNVGTRTPPLSSPTGDFPADRWNRQVLSKQSMPNLRPISPSQNNTSLGRFDFAVKPANPPHSNSYGIASPPLSPPPSGQGEAMVLPVRPNDRGKATASGAFARPSQPYDENKYSQRQLQMQQGRETPPLTKHSTPDAFVPRLNGGRSRADSAATSASSGSGRSASNASANRHFPPHGIPEAQPSTVPENEAVAEILLTSPEDGDMSSMVDSLSKPRASVVPLDLSKMNFQNQNISLERPPESQHPAHRQQAEENLGSYSDPVQSDQGLLTPEFNKPSANMPADSPTLGPATTTSGLSGMVRQHMRSDSNTSSVYGGASSGALTSRFPTETHPPLPQDYYTQSNPWDNDDGWDRDYYASQSSAELPKESKDMDALPPPLSIRSPNVEKGNDTGRSAWERELESHHTRDGSTETQKERLDFKNDLAERRRRVQENLKSFVEADSRSGSPLPEMVSAKNPLGLLKSKSSRGSLAVKTKEPPQLKGMKMLGLGNATITSSPSPNHADFDADVHRAPEDDGANGDNFQRPNAPPTKAFRQARREAQHDRERQTANRHRGQGREGHNPQWRPENRSPQPGNMNHRGPANGRTPRQRSPSKERPPVVTRPSRNGTLESQNSTYSSRSDSSLQSRPSRDRSNSDTSQPRSKSRNGRRNKDDLTVSTSNSQAHYNDLQLPAIPTTPRSAGLPSRPSPLPSPGMPPAGKSRSNSKAVPASNGYIESQQTLAPAKIHEGPYGLPLSPRPSPTASFSVNQTPAQPSPGFASATTPTVVAYQPQPHVPSTRKMSVNKSQISEPKFLHSTSRITTVNLPPEASLQNGMGIMGAPPIPPVNPARRQPRGMFGLRKKDEYEEVQSMPQATQSTEEMSTFSDDGEPQSYRQRLRKVSSEGGHLNAKARQVASTNPSPPMPTTSAFTAPRGNSPPRPPPSGGGMF
jgi:hypothetical protein